MAQQKNDLVTVIGVDDGEICEKQITREEYERLTKESSLNLCSRVPGPGKIVKKNLEFASPEAFWNRFRRDTGKIVQTNTGIGGV